MSVMGGPGLTSAQVAARLHPGYQSGRYYGAQLAGNLSTANGVTADLIYFFPIPCYGGTFSGLSIRSGTLTPGVSAKLALYRNTGEFFDAKPLYAECAGAIDMNAGVAGDTYDLSFSSVLTLPFDLFWGAALFNGAGAPYTLQQATVYGGGLVYQLGSFGMAGMTGTNAGSAIRVTGGAATYASGFPAVTAALSVSNANTGSPIIALKAA